MQQTPALALRIGMYSIMFLLLLTLVPRTGRVIAQSSYNSGSTGADGAFSPTTTQTIQVPASGVYNFTTVNIPSGVTITFTPNATNTPLTILAQGNVTVAGTIVLTGQSGSGSVGGIGGPGGFRGGNGGFGIANIPGTNGDGPGGGGGGVASGSTAGFGAGAGYQSAGGTPTIAGSGQGGPAYGSASLLPLIGGSGGGGAGSVSTTQGLAGGGGGGAILIASSGTVTISGTIHANGGSGAGGSGFPHGGSGSGGAIRLVATTLTGGGTLDVTGGTNLATSGTNAGSPGYVRAEAYNFNSFSPNISPLGASTMGPPNPVNLSGGPSLVIASVAGVNAPAVPNGSLTQSPDIVLPAGQANPVTVQLQAMNIPLGTSAVVTVIPTTGAGSSVSSTVLAGTTASSTAQASVTLPAGVSVITASITINLSNLADSVFPKWIKGEPIEKVEIAATLGGKSHITYITQSGKRVPGD